MPEAMNQNELELLELPENLGSNTKPRHRRVDGIVGIPNQYFDLSTLTEDNPQWHRPSGMVASGLSTKLQTIQNNSNQPLTTHHQ
ncbi:MAG: hypothetical protein RIR79_1198 [Pseudomonadota bacterium]|jgi:hypothetical protein